eukprot:15444526-Alexandrium_andersonii.AAC.1
MQILSMQPRMRGFGTCVLGTRDACAEHAGALGNETRAPSTPQLPGPRGRPEAPFCRMPTRDEAH